MLCVCEYRYHHYAQILARNRVSRLPVYVAIDDGLGDKETQQGGEGCSCLSVRSLQAERCKQETEGINANDHRRYRSTRGVEVDGAEVGSDEW